MDDKKFLVQHGYDLYVRKVKDYRHLSQEHQYLFKLSSLLKPGAKILDVGCGSGVPVAKYLIDKGYKVTGIDISSEQIKLAKKLVPQGEFIQMDMYNMNFPENSFDAIVAIDSLHHIQRDSHQFLLNKFSEILVNKGHLIISVPRLERDEVGYIYEKIEMYWSNYGEMSTLQMLHDAGFKLIHKEKRYSSGSRELIAFAQNTALESMQEASRGLIYSSL